MVALWLLVRWASSDCGLAAPQEIIGDDWATDLVNQVQYVVTEQDPGLSIRLLQQISVEPHIASHAVHALSKRSVRPVVECGNACARRSRVGWGRGRLARGPVGARRIVLLSRARPCVQRVFILMCQAESLAQIIHALDDGGLIQPEYVWITQVVGPVEAIAQRTLDLMHGMFFVSVSVGATPVLRTSASHS